MSKQPLCLVSDVPLGEKICVDADGQKMLVYHLDDGFYATEARCPHMFRSLEKACVNGDGVVQCPLHRARFDVRSGEVVEWANFPPGVQMLNFVRGERYLKTYPVSVEGDHVVLDA